VHFGFDGLVRNSASFTGNIIPKVGHCCFCGTAPPVFDGRTLYNAKCDGVSVNKAEKVYKKLAIERQQFMMMNNRGWSPPYIPILILVIAVLTLVFGWKTLIYYVKSRHPEWRVWTTLRSHRAKEDTEMIIAVFYEIPNQFSRPAPYLLVSLEYGNAQGMRELDPSVYDTYGIKNYK
jgi:hypothetical protein